MSKRDEDDKAVFCITKSVRAKARILARPCETLVRLCEIPVRRNLSIGVRIRWFPYPHPPRLPVRPCETPMRRNLLIRVRIRWFLYPHPPHLPVRPCETHVRRNLLISVRIWWFLYPRPPRFPVRPFETQGTGTGWRGCIGCLKLQVSLCKRAAY